MKIRNFLAALALFSGTAFAQQIHPDLNVPKVDFREFDRQQQSIKEVLEDIEFDNDGKVEALSVTIPDYKDAHKAFMANVSGILGTFEAGMDSLRKEAEAGSKNLSALQSEYSSKLFALEAAMKKYPSSRDTFKKTYDLENARMKADLSEKYKDLIQKLQTNYTSNITNALQTSRVSGMNVRKPGIGDRLAVIGATPFLTVATVVLWVAPAPIPVFFSPNGWCNGQSFISYDNQYYERDCGGFWGVLDGAHESLQVKPKEAAFNAAAKTLGDALFANCKTAACTYEISKSYKKFFLKMIDINEDLEVGDATLSAGPKVKKSRVKKLLKKATELSAEQRPTAIYVKP